MKRCVRWLLFEKNWLDLRKLIQNVTQNRDSIKAYTFKSIFVDITNILRNKTHMSLQFVPLTVLLVL